MGRTSRGHPVGSGNSRALAKLRTRRHSAALGPDMVAYITGNAEPIYGREAHAAAMAQMLRMFPDMHVYSDPYPIQFGSGDWITVVTRATGTFTGEMSLPDGNVAAPDRKGVRRRVRPDHQVARRPADRDFRLLGLRPAGAADWPRLGAFIPSRA